MSGLLEARNLRRDFELRRGPLRRRVGTLRALAGVDLEVARGETHALVGESGCGKTTLARCLLRLLEPSSGTVRFDGEDVLALDRRELRRWRRRAQMIFQDPSGALNPRLRVATLVAEPLRAQRLGDRRERAARVRGLLERVELDPAFGRRFPHELSGGERQRVGIARALATTPDLIVADEPLSALDPPVQARILGLLLDLRHQFNLTLLFISHDLAVVERISDRVGVMYLGRIVEEASTPRLFSHPLHPYTVALLSAVPEAEPAGGRRRIVLAGEPPAASAPPPGCAFHPRCPVASPRCAAERPRLTVVSEGHRVACHHPGELIATGRANPAP